MRFLSEANAGFQTHRKLQSSYDWYNDLTTVMLISLGIGIQLNVPEGCLVNQTHYQSLGSLQDLWQASPHHYTLH